MAAVTSVFENTNVVYTETPSRSFQMYPLQRAFSKSSVFGDQKRRFIVDGRPNRREKSSVFEFIEIIVNETLAAVTEPERFQFYKI